MCLPGARRALPLPAAPAPAASASDSSVPSHLVASPAQQNWGNRNEYRPTSGRPWAMTPPALRGDPVSLHHLGRKAIRAPDPWPDRAPGGKRRCRRCRRPESAAIFACALAVCSQLALVVGIGIVQTEQLCNQWQCTPGAGHIEVETRCSNPRLLPAAHSLAERAPLGRLES